MFAFCASVGRAVVAQWIARLVSTQKVVGSSPTRGVTFWLHLKELLFVTPTILNHNGNYNKILLSHLSYSRST